MLLTIFNFAIFLVLLISTINGLVGLFAFYADFWQEVLVGFVGGLDFVFLLVKKQVCTSFNVIVKADVSETHLGSRGMAANELVL